MTDTQFDEHCAEVKKTNWDIFHDWQENKKGNQYVKTDDPGHGWLRVPINALIHLGILDKITQCSYRKGQYAYLEEDCDIATFTMARIKANRPFHIKYKYVQSTTIRNYTPFYV